MVSWKIKNCPRCKGDLFLDKDTNGWYEQCLQCSCRHELKEIAQFEEEPGKREGELVPAGRSRSRKRR